MSKDTKTTTNELRQSILSRMDAARKGIEELSEEELESICGGGGGPMVENPLWSGGGEHPRLEEFAERYARNIRKKAQFGHY